ncbi:hypothetical protein EV360DRAFT_67276 [Lentinula raphanica]|nr:hypothetical protein EV360DRAFT_67276 [Lentinula raphanica]
MLFEGLKGCFSPLVSASILSSWVNNGGSIMQSEQEFYITSCFLCAKTDDPWVKKLSDKSVTVLHASWVSRCVEKQRLVAISRFVLDGKLEWIPDRSITEASQSTSCRFKKTFLHVHLSDIDLHIRKAKLPRALQAAQLMKKTNLSCPSSVNFIKWIRPLHELTINTLQQELALRNANATKLTYRFGFGNLDVHSRILGSMLELKQRYLLKIQVQEPSSRSGMELHNKVPHLDQISPHLPLLRSISQSRRFLIWYLRLLRPCLQQFFCQERFI